jgi:hypothetical protein
MTGSSRFNRIMNEDTERTGQTEPVADRQPAVPAEPLQSAEIEAGARQTLEAAEGASDEDRLEVLEQLYRNLEGALEQ